MDSNFNNRAQRGSIDNDAAQELHPKWFPASIHPAGFLHSMNWLLSGRCVPVRTLVSHLHSIQSVPCGGGGGCRGQSALGVRMRSVTCLHASPRSISARLCSFGFPAVCPLPAALLAFVHHGCQSREAFSQLDMILSSSAQSGSVAFLRNTLLHYGFHIDCGERVARRREDGGGEGREWERQLAAGETDEMQHKKRN